MSLPLAEAIKRQARVLGFSGVGIASAAPLPEHQRRFRRYLAEGRHGGMAYLAQEPDRRENPARLLPGAKSVISLAVPYYQGDHGAPPADPCGRVARYAWGRDYHQATESRLEALKAFILERAPGAAIRCAVDHAPILERAYAQQAGVGFIGKHTLLITPDHGSWVLLAELITDLELDPDEPGFTQCGTCTRCLDACPTGALTEPFHLDATRCIAYLTIEHKGEAPTELSREVGDWLFGCDICQEACPYNRIAALPPAFPELHRDAGVGPWLSLEDASRPRSHGAFDRRFAASPLHRAGRKGLRRNAHVVRNNQYTGDPLAGAIR
ncbi:MAG: tRNA epoxyqueuosine(34) reductase QueG [Nitrospirota bacterium]